MQRYPCRSKLPKAPDKFGVEVCADTLLAYTNESWGLDGEEFGLVMYDRGTTYTGGFPQGTKDADDHKDSLREFLGSAPVQRFYSDCAPELIRAAKDLNLAHDTATPNRPDTNGVAERCVRKVVEGTKCLLAQAGFPPSWWPKAMRCFCHALNIEVVNGDSAWNRRHQKGQWSGPVIPFGAKVDYRPQPTKAQLQQKFEPAARVGLFLGYNLGVGGTWKRNGGLMVTDLEHTFAKGAGVLDPFEHNPQFHVQYVSEVEIPAEGISFPLKPSFDARNSGTIYQIMPEGYAHLHDLPAQEPDKQDTDMEFNGDASDEGGDAAVEGGIFDAPTDAPTVTDGTSTGLRPDEAPHGGNGPAAAPPAVPDDGGRNARRHKGTGRPPHVWPELWQTWSWAKRKKATAQWAAECKSKGTNWWGETLSGGTAAVASGIEPMANKDTSNMNHTADNNDSIPTNDKSYGHKTTATYRRPLSNQAWGTAGAFVH